MCVCVWGGGGGGGGGWEVYHITGNNVEIYIVQANYYLKKKCTHQDYFDRLLENCPE